MLPLHFFWRGYMGGMTGADLRAWRASHRLSRPALADLLGISVSRLVDYESGVSRSRGTPAVIPRMVDLALAELERRLARDCRAAE